MKSKREEVYVKMAILSYWKPNKQAGKDADLAFLKNQK